ncbi:hypothetical protein N0V84_000058 [Fusarium piperis]|uniref:Uncharacterized protein n=1 Tax=Fusarium piperis TaxID=1435070 RepID=A0A9W8WNL9_9HYPO|nr:hypothetical protein N0V84_000058 [Fusarium piperis]
MFNYGNEDDSAWHQWVDDKMQEPHLVYPPPPEPLAVDPALQQFATFDQFNMAANNFFVGNQAMNNSFVAPQLEQNNQVGPVVAQEPIAQGLQNNVSNLGFVFSETASNPIVPQIANTVPVAPPKVEQVPDFVHDTESPSEDEHDVDAEGEPATLQGVVGFPNPVPMTAEAIEAIVRLRSLPRNHLSLVIFQLQNELNLRERMVMANDEMDIDQPEQIDGIPAFADSPLFGTSNPENDQDQPQPTRAARHNANNNQPKPEIHDIPLPDHSSSSSRDDYLKTCRELGFSYRQIKEVGGFTEAESTLRGRYRTLTKPANARVRHPTWKQDDIVLLRNVVYNWYIDTGNQLDSNVRPPWKELAQKMANQGSSYHFGSGTVSKMWKTVHQADRDEAARLAALEAQR